MFRRTADVRVRADLDLTLPALKDGRPTVEVVPASEQLEAYVKTRVERAEAIRNRQVEPDEDNMLKVTGDGRHAALNQMSMPGLKRCDQGWFSPRPRPADRTRPANRSSPIPGRPMHDGRPTCQRADWEGAGQRL